MRSIYFCLAISSCLLVYGELRAENDPQAVLDKARKALGGADKLARIQAVETKIKGFIHAPDGALPFSATTHEERPSRFKHSMTYDRNGVKTVQTQVFDGDTLAIRVDSQILTIDPPLREALQAGKFAERLAGLAMIDDKTVTWKELGESKVQGNPVFGVQASGKGKPDVSLFFDRTNGLLVKTEHRQLDPRSRLEIVQEVFYSDYRILDRVDADEQTLKNAKIDSAGPALVAYFREMAKKGDGRERILELIKMLGDDTFETREKASADLEALGAPAIPFLKEAMKKGEIEVMRRAERCLQAIQQDSNKKEADITVPMAVARRLAARKPEGATEVLLDALPGVTNERVAREIRAALAAVAVIAGKPDPFLVKALDDKDPRRRSEAAEALGRVKPTQPWRKIDLEGIKRPMKVAVYRSGRKFMEWEVVEISDFNKFDAPLFVLP